MAKKVFIGVGHGGKDPGAVAFGREEADLNLAIALKCRDELVRHGVEVKMSRTKDENDTLQEEIKECNAFAGPDDLAIDIHNNAGGGDGAEAYYYTGGGTSKVLAENVLAEIVKIGQNSRGAKPNVINGIKEYFGFIRETKAHAIIVECAFVDNKTDIKIIDTAAEQAAMGVAVAKGILKTLNIAYVEEKVESTSSLYRVQIGAYSQKSNADAMLKKVKAKGFDAFVTKVGNLYKVQVGAFSKRANAEAMLDKVKKAGFDAFITTV